MINCDNFKNMIKDFLEDKLSLDKKRKFICHLAKCHDCQDVLLEEYIFYVTYNDLDDNISLNYRDNLYNNIYKVKEEIREYDEKKIKMYIFFSIALIFIVINIISIIIRILYL